MERLVDIVKAHAYPMKAPAPAVILVSPPPVCRTADIDFDAMFDGGLTESKKLPGLYRQVADENGCGFFDAGTVAQTTPLDGVHLDAENTRAVGSALAPLVRQTLGL
jgi:lysophospholipase L1-like esterase